MTENEAIEEIKSWTNIFMNLGSHCTNEMAEAQEMAISALEEVKQYRLQGYDLDKVLNMDCDYSTLTDIIENYGVNTAEKLKESLEKQIPKQPIETPDCAKCELDDCNIKCESYETGHSIRCPNCNGNRVRDYEYSIDCSYCPECSQRLDWSEV